jgi:hypothetical protein
MPPTKVLKAGFRPRPHLTMTAVWRQCGDNVAVDDAERTVAPVGGRGHGSRWYVTETYNAAGDTLVVTVTAREVAL